MPIPVTPDPARRPPTPQHPTHQHTTDEQATRQQTVEKEADAAWRRRQRRRHQILKLIALALLLLIVLGGMPALAATAAPPAPTLDSVIDGLRVWLVGLLAAVATLFLTIGGIRYITAGGDPMQVERAKTALKSAAIGYALAALAPLLVAVLRSIVG